MSYSLLIAFFIFAAVMYLTQEHDLKFHKLRAILSLGARMIAASQCARYDSADDNLARVDIGRNFAVRSDGDPAIGKMDRALHFPIDVQVVAAFNFTFN